MTRRGWGSSLALVGALGLTLAVGEARPCSLAEGPAPSSLALDRATVGATPLLVTTATTVPARLWREGDPARTPIPVVVDEGLSGLFVGREAVVAYRPASPLEAGSYWWTGYRPYNSTMDFYFWVDPAVVEVAPTLTGGALTLHLDEPDEPGCGGGTSCDGIDFTRLVVSFTADAETFALALRNPRTGAVRVELVGSEYPGTAAQQRVLVWDDPQRWPGAMKRDRLCVTVAPLSEGGAIGEAQDLGCIGPDDKGPRVVDSRGCAVGASGPDSLALWLALLLLTHVALRRRHRA